MQEVAYSKLGHAARKSGRNLSADMLKAIREIHRTNKSIKELEYEMKTNDIETVSRSIGEIYDNYTFTEEEGMIFKPLEQLESEYESYASSINASTLNDEEKLLASNALSRLYQKYKKTYQAEQTEQANMRQ